jgi:hypothetical protein
MKIQWSLKICLKIGLMMLMSLPLRASFERAEDTWKKSSGPSSWRKQIIELTKSGYTFSAVALMKDYLVQNRSTLDQDLDQAFEKILLSVGVRPFETLPLDVLTASRSSLVRYIMAKKYFRKGDWNKVLAETNKITDKSNIYSFSLHLKATALAQLGKHSESELIFKECLSVGGLKSLFKTYVEKQDSFTKNQHSCAAGLARAAFNQKKYDQAELLYLDIPKSSFIWPYILAEEAWNSYFQKNYNRTLGKLVSYQAPIFDFIFNPEIDILKALAYMRLCLFADVKKVSDDFTMIWSEPSKDLLGFILKNKADPFAFYRFVTSIQDKQMTSNFLIRKIALSVAKDPAWLEMKASLLDALTEYSRLKSKTKGKYSLVLRKNIKDYIYTIQKIMGYFALNQFNHNKDLVAYAFQGMSYIKLEVLAKRKEAIYSNLPEPGTKRGDIKYLDRNDKQYFWDFNGEFWADELGDYVFALGSKC